MQVSMVVNGEKVTREIEGRLLLVHFLRDHLWLTGTHWGCDTSNCGTCVVWLDGEPVKSCTVLAAMAGGHEVRTVEGLEQNGELDPAQRGFVECHGLQCGFCTPGMDGRREGPKLCRGQPEPPALTTGAHSPVPWTSN
ncbi:carbon-monoxide dehydrogenase small subunit [Streptomyces sp. 3213]|uniref:(2Fe-2S)-binding protein n=1 Tax=Streptomyces sp. 3213.3 TaxID=1855348 RepID=UPI000899CA07|nr:carbon-monoxide dehydrogenase small subunit [Streptomyces sp. 3213] [Streptomyces sp. 3213.3]